MYIMYFEASSKPHKRQISVPSRCSCICSFQISSISLSRICISFKYVSYMYFEASSKPHRKDRSLPPRSSHDNQTSIFSPFPTYLYFFKHWIYFFKHNIYFLHIIVCSNIGYSFTESRKTNVGFLFSLKQDHQRYKLVATENLIGQNRKDLIFGKKWKRI